MSYVLQLRIGTYRALPWESFVAPMEKFFGERIAKVLAYPLRPNVYGPRNYLELLMASEYEVKQVRLVDREIRHRVCGLVEQIGIPFGTSEEDVREALRHGWCVGDPDSGTAELDHVTLRDGVCLDRLLDPYQGIDSAAANTGETILSVLWEHTYPHAATAHPFGSESCELTQKDLRTYLGLPFDPWVVGLDLLPQRLLDCPTYIVFSSTPNDTDTNA